MGQEKLGKDPDNQKHQSGASKSSDVAQNFRPCRERISLAILESPLCREQSLRQEEERQAGADGTQFHQVYQRLHSATFDMALRCTRDSELLTKAALMMLHYRRRRNERLHKSPFALTDIFSASSTVSPTKGPSLRPA
jgi:hypothetical protein